jgi:transcriptional regulator GlxA family with amidase domain
MGHTSKHLPPPIKGQPLPFKTAELFSSHRIQLVLDYLADSYCQRISIARLSEMINLSPSRFSHMFKAQTGTSPMQYLKLLRLKRAVELLHTTCMSVKEVMFEVGFNDASHFVRDFRRIYGLTPGQHRAVLLLDAVTESTDGRPSRTRNIGDTKGQ